MVGEENNQGAVDQYLSLLQSYRSQINSLNEQAQYIQAMINDYRRARITIENYSKNDEDEDLLFPVGGGVFISADAKKTSKVLLEVGSGVVVEKGVEEATKKIDEQVDSLQENLEQVSNNIQQLQQNASELSQKIRSMSG